MCESLLGIEGSSLNAFTNRLPTFADITSRLLYIHELAAAHCTVPLAGVNYFFRPANLIVAGQCRTRA